MVDGGANAINRVKTIGAKENNDGATVARDRRCPKAQHEQRKGENIGLRVAVAGEQARGMHVADGAGLGREVGKLRDRERQKTGPFVAPLVPSLLRPAD